MYILLSHLRINWKCDILLLNTQRVSFKSKDILLLLLNTQCVSFKSKDILLLLLNTQRLSFKSKDILLYKHSRLTTVMTV